jgi:hypothetical protein
MGILIPFAFFVVALFLYLHTLWMENATGNADDYSSGKQPYEGVDTAGGGPSADFAFNASRSMGYSPDVNRRPIFTTASRPGYLSNR